MVMENAIFLSGHDVTENRMAMRRMTAVLAMGLLVGVAGCASSQERRRKDEAACAGYGFRQGTPELAGCLQRESLGRRYGAGW